LILFSFRYKSIKPSIASIDFSLTKNILNLGVKFFIIQISGIIIYSSTNLIITQFYDPTAVTSYNIAFKYFSIITMVYGILISPFWSSVTEAYELGDIQWLKNTIKKYNYVSGILIIGIIIMLMVSSFVYKWWVGSNIYIPFSLSVVVALQTLMYVVFTPYISFLNGVGKIKLITYFVVIQSLIYIPLVFVFNKYLAIGVAGILLVSIVIELPLKITQYIQSNKIINQKAKGIWNE
jgi:O-antigen/teichoic acid export membrane protein